MASRRESSLWVKKPPFPPRKKFEQPWGGGGNYSLHQVGHSCQGARGNPGWVGVGPVKERGRAHKKDWIWVQPPGSDSPLQLGDPGQNSDPLRKTFPDCVVTWSPPGRFPGEWSWSWEDMDGHRGAERRSRLRSWPRQRYGGTDLPEDPLKGRIIFKTVSLTGISNLILYFWDKNAGLLPLFSSQK